MWTPKKSITKMDILAVDSRKAELNKGMKEQKEVGNSLGIPMVTSEREIEAKIKVEETIHLTSMRGTLTFNFIYPF